jgi:integrase
MARLTNTQIQHAPVGRHADADGLYLLVTKGPTGLRRSWVLRFQLHGKRRDLGLGGAASISGRDARLLAAEARALIARGVDPIEHRNELIEAKAQSVERAKGSTFKEIAEDYISAKRPEWKSSKHADQWANTLQTYAYPTIGKKVVSEITVEDVLKVLKPIWTVKTETAVRVRSRIELILDAAAARKLRSSENPARWRGNLASLLAAPRKVTKVKHFPALPVDELPDFMQALRAVPGVSALCLELTILTTCRSNESRAARWSEIDEKNRLWMIPAERMKAQRPHRVPLSDAALAVLKKAKEMPRKRDINGNHENDLIFPAERSGKALCDMALLMTVRRLRKGFTVHGFRSTFRDWSAERTTYPGEMAEMQLAHVISDKTEAAYRRGDQFEKRRQMMTDWAAWCEPQKKTKEI